MTYKAIVIRLGKGKAKAEPFWCVKCGEIYNYYREYSDNSKYCTCGCTEIYNYKRDYIKATRPDKLKRILNEKN